MQLSVAELVAHLESTIQEIEAVAEELVEVTSELTWFLSEALARPPSSGLTFRSLVTFRLPGASVPFAFWRS